MSKKLSVLELPIYKEHFKVFLEALDILDEKMSSEKKHGILLKETYETIIQIFPNLTADYNYWDLKGKLKIYNKVRILLSYIQCQLHILYELEVLEKEYYNETEDSIRYVSGLIKKLESLPNEP